MKLIYENDSITVFLDKSRKVLTKIFSSSRVTNLEINDELEVIEDGAMKDNYLTDINLKNVKFIGESAFENNDLNGLLVIPETTEYIGEKAFKNNNIEEVVITNSNTILSNDSFDQDTIITIKQSKKLLLK